MIEVLQFGLSMNRGGIETYLYKIWNHINHEEYHFSFIDMTGEGNRPCFYEELISSGCTFYKITPRNVSVKKNREDVRKLFKEHHFDIFHFNVNTLSYLYPVEIALKNRCKVIVHSRSSGSFNGKKSYSSVLHRINRHRLSKMDVTRIAVSDKAGKWMFQSAPYRVYNNGVDTQRYRFNQENRQRIRHSLEIEDGFVLGHIGTFIPVKNHRFVIDVFNEYHQQNSNSILLLVGEGYLQNSIKQYVIELGLSDSVYFLGKRDDLPDLYSAMDLLLLPSLLEGFPNVILEAQCEGVICIQSDVVTSEVMILDSCQSLSLAHGAKYWAEHIGSTPCSPTIRETAYQIVEEKGFSCDVEIKRLESLYFTLAKRNQ